MNETTTDRDAAHSPPARRKAQDLLICNQIFDAILEQQLLPGTKLTEEELAGIFAVSRTVVRNALLRLSQDGIVDIKPNRGAFVACPDARQAREILGARRIIEAALIREAAGACGAEQLARLRANVARERQSIESGNRGGSIRLSGEFHLLLADIAGNATLRKYLRELVPLTSLIIARYERPGAADCSHTEHEGLIEAMAAGDADRAAALMERHLRHIEDKLNLSDAAAPPGLQEIFSPLDRARG